MPISSSDASYAKWIKNYDIANFSRLTLPERKKVVAEAQEKLLRRFESLKNLGKYDVSYAMIKFKENAKIIDTGKANENQLLAQFARIQDFFSSVSSTKAGAHKISIDQDKRIFGTTSKYVAGRWVQVPMNRMTADERQAYWAAYDEFELQHAELIASRGSERIQQALGEMVKEGDLEFSQDFLDRLYTRAKSIRGISDEPNNIRRGHLS